MKRPTFGVVTMVVTTLAVFGVLAHYLQPLIGTVPANSLASAPEPFLSQGGSEAIDWQRLDDRVFAKALHAGLPLLLFIGSGDSWLSRQFDKWIFTDRDVMSRLRRSFVCVRVDSDALPRWSNAFRPVTRARDDYLSDLTVVALSPQGRLIRTYLPAPAPATIDFRTFLAFLVDADHDAARPLSDSDAQQQEVDAISNSSGQGLPDFGTQLSALVGYDNPNGGFPQAPNQHLMPLAWRFMLLQGRYDAFRASIDPVLVSPVVNWLDGGFFRSARSLDWNRVDYDENAELDAEMMQTLALAAVGLHDSFYRWMAERTFDRLIDNFGSSGWVAEWQKGDEGAEDRSELYSFPPRLLRDLFPDEKQRDWAQDNLEMKVSANPLMTPQLRDREVWESERQHLDAVLNVLRKGRTGSPVFGPDGVLEVNGLVAARLISCARLWHDTIRLAKAVDLATRLDIFRSGDDVSRTNATEMRSKGMLPDYLAYADACLETYLATGRLDRFREGNRVLRRALFLFSTPQAGVYVLDSAPGKVPPNSNPPEILDHFRESCTGWLIRLTLAYGQLEGRAGRDLTGAAYSAASRFSATGNGIGPAAAGYFNSASRIARAEAAVCVGPKADLLSQQLYEASPSRVIAISGGEARGDLSRRAPGIYLIRGEEISGPFSVSEATRLMPLAFPFDAPIPR